jgi:hypothetical protein
MLGQQQSLFADIELPADVYCRGCRRTISTEKSLERGYGPTCWIHHLEDMLQNEPEPPELPARLRVKMPAKPK